MQSLVFPDPLCPCFKTLQFSGVQILHFRTMQSLAFSDNSVFGIFGKCRFWCCYCFQNMQSFMCFRPCSLWCFSPAWAWPSVTPQSPSQTRGTGAFRATSNLTRPATYTAGRSILSLTNLLTTLRLVCLFTDIC